MVQVLVLCCVVGAAVAQAQPDARLQEERTAFDEAKTLWDAGQYADAITRGERALALREAVLGGTHPEVAASLDWLGLHHLLRGDLVQAEPLLQRAVAIREAALGKDHPELAGTLTTLGNLYAAQALYGRAEPLYAQALALREAAFGKDHLSVAEPLHHLAKLYSDQRLYARAEPLFLRALAIREAALGPGTVEVAQTLHALAWLYDLQGLYAQARPLAERALAIREVALGKDHPLVADSLLDLIGHYQSQGMNELAEQCYARGRAILEAALGKNPPDVATALWRLAHFYLITNGSDRAEPLVQRAIALREATLGAHHPLVAELLSWLGLFYFDQGLYSRAEPVLERAAAIRASALGENHPLLADVLLDLGDLYVAQGLDARAEPLLRRAWTIRKEAFGENSRFTATALHGLGQLYLAQGQYARAEPLLRRALAIQETVFGKRHPFVARTLCRLGDLYLAQGQYASAEPLLRRALATLEASAGRNHPTLAPQLNHLADLYSAQGQYTRARPLYERALALVEASAGPQHPSVAEMLNQLGVVHLSQHRLDQALPLFTRAFAVSEQRLRQESLGFSEARLASFLQRLRDDEERLYALLRAHPEDAHVRRLALGAALLLKGRSVEESASISRTVYRSLGAQDRDTFERLRGLRTQLTKLSLQSPGTLAPADYQRRLAELTEQGNALETDLAQRSAPLRALAALPPPAEIVDRVAAALPRDAALVEFITYVDRPLVPRRSPPGQPPPGQLRYLALVLLPDATVRFRDLGPAEPIDSAASRLRDALANRDADFQATAQALYQRAFQPLLPLLGPYRRLFLSPDGQLALVPFAALHDGQRFLVDAFDFTYLSSGKNLLPRPPESAPPEAVIVVADPDFHTPLPARPGSQDAAPVLAERGELFSLLRANLAQRAWAPTPLPGTRKEAEAIQRLLPQARLFLGSEATKERLLRLPPPGILHLATHGFFLEDAPQRPDSRALGQFGVLGEDTRPRYPPDPLLRSGLVLAGASAPAPSGASAASPSAEHALVTALELAGLDLWGTQLVVLSACDTGRGDVKLGQGVYGLRRAFLVAGAETVVMSLWKVNDETTRILMEAYYRHLLAGQGRATALREAMRELRRTQPHPHYWAPFLAMGRETPLRLSPPTFHEPHRR
ncbi:MAG TPA: tetratricopeptide repeat protein [Myxococcaceae bacterium]|nr:tetratricopeptide repeat protein [Myxococcaceae bacterium]